MNKENSDSAILVVGNGPSFTTIDYRRLPRNYKVMRFNEFWKEDKFYAGKRVDYCVCYQRALDVLYYCWRTVTMSGEYDIDMVNGIYATVLFETNKHFPTVKLATELIQENAAIAEFRCFYEYYHEQYLPTGMQGVALAARLGYRDIYLAGFDLFVDTDVMHPWDENITTKDNLNRIHNRHPAGIQFDFLNLLKNEFADIKILSVSETSPINKQIELAPIIRGNASIDIEQKNEPYTKEIAVPDRINDKNRDFA